MFNIDFGIILFSPDVDGTFYEIAVSGEGIRLVEGTFCEITVPGAGIRFARKLPSNE
jgi:hypothetical protein